jgi:acyl dehydratase
MVTSFVQLSGDDGPLHTNAETARTHGFEGCLVHGALLVALLSRFVGTKLPGPNAVWLQCDIRFMNPCYAPAVLRLDGTITQCSEATHAVAMTTQITDDRNRRIAMAKTRHKVLPG